MPATRKELLASIADKIADYREGEIAKMSSTHVEKWVVQFPKDVQDAMLVELEHVLKNTYISRQDMNAFLRSLANNQKFTGANVAGFWRNAHLLDIQGGGASQREMLALFHGIIKGDHGADGKGSHPYIYIDDAIFSGTRVKSDLGDWIQNHAPAKAEVRVVAAAIHTGGEYYANKEISKAISRSGKKIDVSWWRAVTPENRKSERNSSDVLWPTELPADNDVTTYAKYLSDNNYPAVLRQPGSVGGKKFFSSDSGRILLEQQLLIAGARLRRICSNMHEVLRPLGFMGLKTLGFGSVIVTFRNCPNTCPLAFWAGDPWYPLFPRSTNSDAFMRRMLSSARTPGSGGG